MRLMVSADAKQKKGWKLAKNAWQAISILSSHQIDELVLDYDYGDVTANGNGVCVLAWIHKEITKDEYYIPPKKIEFVPSKSKLEHETLSCILKHIREKELTVSY